MASPKLTATRKTRPDPTALVPLIPLPLDAVKILSVHSGAGNCANVIPIGGFVGAGETSHSRSLSLSQGAWDAEFLGRGASARAAPPHAVALAPGHRGDGLAAKRRSPCSGAVLLRMGRAAVCGATGLFREPNCVNRPAARKRAKGFLRARPGKNRSLVWRARSRGESALLLPDSPLLPIMASAWGACPATARY